MSKSVWRVTEGTTTFTTNASRFAEMYDANFQTAYAMRNKLNENTIFNNLSGISGTALSLLLGVAGATRASTALSIFSVISSVSDFELRAQERVIDQGTNALRRLKDWLEARPQYIQAEVLFGYLQYEYTDGSTARFVQGDDYVIQRLQIESGEWIT